MKQAPIFASLRTAAKLLDMTAAEFARLVEAGALPGPAKFERWDVDQLKKIMRGDSARQEGLEI